MPISNSRFFSTAFLSICLAFFLALMQTSESSGQNVQPEIISVNFHLGDDANAQADHELAAGEIAGLHDNSAWNNVNVGNGGATDSGTIFATTSLSSNSTTNVATISSGASSSRFVGRVAGSAVSGNELGLSGNHDDLFNSYLALNGPPNSDGNPDDSAEIEVSGLGPEFTTSGYDLFIYSDTDRGSGNNADRTSRFAVTPAGETAINVLTEDDGSLGPSATFSGAYVESDNSDTSDAYSNYVVIRGLTAASFKIGVSSPDGGRGGISGFEIVEAVEDVDVPNPDGPNVILLVVDDMGWSDWEKRSDFYETPNMTRLANLGVEFTNAYSSASICSPTRASMITGLTPAKHKITKWIPGNPDNIITNVNEPLTDLNLVASQFTTLAQAMSDGGYHTAQMGKWHLGQEGNPAADPLNAGYDINVGGNHRGSPNSYTSRNTYLTLPGMDSNINENFITDHLAEEAKNYIEDRVSNGEKFFLHFNFYAVHTPIRSHPDFISHFESKPDGQFHDNASYASMVAGMDAALGKILDTLVAQGIDDDTVVMFTSDHGGLTSPNSVTSNFPLRGGKGQQWEGGNRVPTIISGPGFLEGTTTDHQIITHDFYPTILALTGVAGDAAYNDTVEGRSFADVLTGANSTGRGEALTTHFPHESNHNGGPYGLIVNGEWKFIENYQTGQQLLYNLSDDLDESTNLIGSDPVLAANLRTALHDHLRETEARLWGGDFVLVWGLGDVNRDGSVNFLDVSPFISILTSGGNQYEADVNQDGVVSFLDISPFISQLSQ